MVFDFTIIYLAVDHFLIALVQIHKELPEINLVSREFRSSYLPIHSGLSLHIFFGFSLNDEFGQGHLHKGRLHLLAQGLATHLGIPTLRLLLDNRRLLALAELLDCQALGHLI